MASSSTSGNSQAPPASTSSSMSSWDSIHELARDSPALGETHDLHSFLATTAAATTTTAANNSNTSLATSTAESQNRAKHNAGQLQHLNHDDEDEEDDGHDHRYLPTKFQLELRKNAPQIPDLRFEASYRRSISKANGSWWKIALITLKDQVTFPLLQGFLWNLALVGVKTWRLSAASSGATWGRKYIAP